MTVSLDELVALMKQRATPEGFPEREELYGLLEPFRALADQESVRLALAATLRKGDRLVARLAAEALAYLGRADAGPLLVDIVADESLSISQRAAAVWAMDRHLPRLREQLGPAEHSAYMSLPILEMLEDPEADQGFGMNALLGGYLGMSASGRTSLVSAFAQAARERGIKIAGLCMHLLGAEPDRARRTHLLALAAADGSQEAADLLATFGARAADEQEALLVRDHLRLLGAKGLLGVVRTDLEEARALVTGVDGDACFSVNLIIPRVPTFDLANLLFHLETGVRDGFTMHNLPSRSLDELVRKIRAGCGTFSAFVPVPLAARMVDECLQASPPAAREIPDVAEAIAMAEPTLAGARATGYRDPPSPARVAPTVEEVQRLFGSEGFESWFFETGEKTVQKSLASLDPPFRSQGKAAAKGFASRLAKATEELCQRLRGDGEHLRLQRMLRHQARVLECAGDDDRARLCRTLAVEVEGPESIVLAHMAVKAIVAALEPERDADRAGRFLEAREHLRARLGHEPHGHRKVDVARLDLAAAAHTEMSIINREAPSAQRIALAAIEEAALVLGGQFVDLAAEGKPVAEVVEQVVETLGRRNLFAPAARQGLATGIVSGLVGFRESICESRCGHGCFRDPDGDGRPAFYADGFPWQSLEVTPAPSRRNRA
jgi:hypothetical protein